MLYRAVTTEILFILENDDEVLKGFYSVIWEVLASRFNFSLVSVGDFDYGVAHSEHNGTGVIGTLLRNETDFAVIPMYLKDTAIEWLDYTSVVVYESWVLVSGPPQKFQSDYLSILSCFDRTLWFATLIALLIYCLIWEIMAQWVKSAAINWRSFTKEFAIFLFDSAMALLNQHREYKSGRLYQRLYWISWRIASMCLVWSFTGIMLAKLATKNDPLRYEILEDVMNDKNMKLLLMKDSPPYDEIKASLNPVEKKLFERVLNDGTAVLFKDMKYAELMDQMVEGKLIVVMNEASFLHTITIMCGLGTGFYTSRKPYTHVRNCLYMRKGLDHRVKEFIKYLALKTNENQLIQSKLNTAISLGKMCLVSNSIDAPLDEPLMVEKFYFLSIFYGVIASFAICSLFFEMLSFSSTKRASKKRRIRQYNLY